MTGGCVAPRRRYNSLGRATGEIALIDFDDVGFARGPTEVLDAVTLRILPGRACLVIGGTGAGKSTLIALCHGGLRPSRGTLRHFGALLPPRDRVAVADLRRRVGVVERGARFLPHASLRDNVVAPLVAQGIDPAARAGDIDALVAWVGLAGRAEAKPVAATAGERQRAALARAVILDPEVIVADDPAAGLDPAEAAALLGLFADLARMGRGLLVAVQDEGQAAWLAERATMTPFRLADRSLEAAA
jgi:cell division transport system ATP-binding protein